MSEQLNSMKLTGKEEEVMNLYWSMGAKFVRELLDYYDEPKPHFNTLSTIVRGLEEKGFLSHHTFGTTYQYYPLISKEEFRKRTLKGVINKYFNSSLFSAVSALVQEEHISAEELRILIDQVERTNATPDKNKR